MAKRKLYTENLYMSFQEGTLARIDAAAAIQEMSRQDFVRLAIVKALEAVESKTWTTWRTLLIAAMQENGEPDDIIQEMQTLHGELSIGSQDISDYGHKKATAHFGNDWLDKPFARNSQPFGVVRIATNKHLYGSNHDNYHIEVWPLSQAEPITDETRIGELPKTL